MSKVHTSRTCATPWASGMPPPIPGMPPMPPNPPSPSPPSPDGMPPPAPPPPAAPPVVGGAQGLGRGLAFGASPPPDRARASGFTLGAAVLPVIGGAQGLGRGKAFKTSPPPDHVRASGFTLGAAVLPVIGGAQGLGRGKVFKASPPHGALATAVTLHHCLMVGSREFKQLDVDVEPLHTQPRRVLTRMRQTHLLPSEAAVLEPCSDGAAS
eukprot:1152034-Pelagomonas_calceolata.AAC.4